MMDASWGVVKVWLGIDVPSWVVSVLLGGACGWIGWAWDPTGAGFVALDAEAAFEAAPEVNPAIRAHRLEEFLPLVAVAAVGTIAGAIHETHGRLGCLDDFVLGGHGLLSGRSSITRSWPRSWRTWM